MLRVPSGQDSLSVRRAYLRERRSGRLREHVRSGMWIALGLGISAWIVTVVAGLVLGS